MTTILNNSESPFRRPATDLTLVLGAESHVLSLNNEELAALKDPFGRECLIDFIDLAVNAPSIYLPLPAEEDGGWPDLIREMKGTNTVHHLPEAAKHPHFIAEQSLAEQFENFFFEKGIEQVHQWTKFQLCHSIVTSGHKTRISKLISDEGMSAWHAIRDLNFIERMLQDFSRRDSEAFTHLAAEKEQTKIKKMEELLLCYAYDVFRRGWNYAGRVAAIDDGALYYPHTIRRYSLDASQNWMRAKDSERLWSWGAYVTNLLEARAFKDKQRVSPHEVGDLVLRIRAAIEKVGCPRLDAPRFLDLEGILNAAAYEAKLPRIRVARGSTGTALAAEGMNTLGDDALEEVVVRINEELASFLSLGGFLVVPIADYFLPSSITYPIAEAKKELWNCLSKGMYGRPGLFAQRR